MKTRGTARFAALAGAAVLLGGCYTIVQAPYTSSAVPVEERYAPEAGPDGDYLSPRVGRFRGRDGYDDYWGYGASPYGYGFPIYDSRYGLTSFGTSYSPYYGYGRGYGGYYSAHGPYGYGYDPYYYGTGGTYVPPGYQLVTSGELQQLRDDSRLLHTIGPAGPTQAELERQRQEKARRAEEAWSRRVDTRERKEPQPTVRTVSTVTSSTSTSSTSKPAATQSSGSKSAKDRKKRR